jgi:hypothetical protein
MLEPTSADRSGRALCGTYCLHPLEDCGREFKCHLGVDRCLGSYYVCVVLLLNNSFRWILNEYKPESIFCSREKKEEEKPKIDVCNTVWLMNLFLFETDLSHSSRTAVRTWTHEAVIVTKSLLTKNGSAAFLRIVSDDFTCHSLSHPPRYHLNCIGWGPMPTQITVVSISQHFASRNCSVDIQLLYIYIKRWIIMRRTPG